MLVQTLQEGLKKAEASISATSAANASLWESVNKNEDSIAELSAQKTMLTTERDALLENKKILKTQIEELKTTLTSKQNDFDQTESDLSEKLKSVQGSLKLVQS